MTNELVVVNIKYKINIWNIFENIRQLIELVEMSLHAQGALLESLNVWKDRNA